jgi:hypothetical protein
MPHKISREEASKRGSWAILFIKRKGGPHQLLLQCGAWPTYLRGERERARAREREREREREIKREREGGRERKWEREGGRERESESVCVRERERERARESVCV